jgi:hypothetical protein
MQGPDSFYLTRRHNPAYRGRSMLLAIRSLFKSFVLVCFLNAYDAAALLVLFDEVQTRLFVSARGVLWPV